MLTVLTRLALLCLLLCTAHAEEEKKASDSGFPTLTSVQPFVVEVGMTNKVTVRGKRLGDATLRLVGCSAPTAFKVIPNGDPKAEKADPKKDAPEQQVDLEFRLPDDVRQGTNVTLIASNTNGESKALILFVLPNGRLAQETEPNGGFKTAQRLDTHFFVSGSISDAADVDVYKIHLTAGQGLKVEVLAARFKSSLDGSLTIYDAKGSILASNDDYFEKDPMARLAVPGEGDYFIALTSVGEIPAKTTAPYLIKLAVEQ
jgi:hypothetical protein